MSVPINTSIFAGWISTKKTTKMNVPHTYCNTVKLSAKRLSVKPFAVGVSHAGCRVKAYFYTANAAKGGAWLATSLISY